MLMYGTEGFRLFQMTTGYQYGYIADGHYHIRWLKYDVIIICNMVAIGQII